MALSHWIFAGLGALAVWPLKHIWENWIEKFWTAFWVTFKAGFKTTPGGKQFLSAYHEARAKKDQEIIKEHPELKDMLTCKKCDGSGHMLVICSGCGLGDAVEPVCDGCGGTGLV